MFCASWRGNFPGAQMISAPSGGKVAGAFADPAAKNRTNLSPFGDYRSRSDRSSLFCPKAEGRQARGTSHGKAHPRSPPTILFTRPRHPHALRAAVVAALAATSPPGRSPWPLLRRSGRATPRRTPAMPRSATDLVTGQTASTSATSRSATTHEFLTVTYETTFPWCVLKTDLHVATSDLAGIPKIRMSGTPNCLRIRLRRGVRLLRMARPASRSRLDEIGGGVEPEETVSSPPAPWSKAKARTAPTRVPAR